MALNTELNMLTNKSESGRTPINGMKSMQSFNEDLSEESVSNKLGIAD